MIPPLYFILGVIAALVSVAVSLVLAFQGRRYPITSGVAAGLVVGGVLWLLLSR